MSRNVKLIGFLLLLVAVFAGARVAGAARGPLTTGHAQVGYTRPGGTGGMDMGSAP